MKKQTFITAGAVALLALTIGGTTASAADVGVYNSNAKVKFVPDTAITPPVDPTAPGSEVTPKDPDGITDPNPGTNGPLSIDFASSFGFDEQKITTKDVTYNAKAQVLSDGSLRPNYLQVTDKRGGTNGWTVQLKQDTQFKSASGTLDGALISVANGQVDSVSTSLAPSIAKANFDLTIDANGDGVAENILGAKTGEGAGTWVYRFGSDAAEGATSISLAVPGNTTKYAEEYVTGLTWTLSDTPQP
ncbi:WxL domain-containing protein [Carnobacterium gallinarum]|uniref:WxL domain-containing protein n=1 Tax=Carnobacterium gallinarum TaxID=2749 RepID=UPI00054CDF08|nr:WxL domain-containing protein [Carnobacterium gallinarum]